jgi:DNA polymerase V
MYALVDGNNFYVSCERVFRPDLEDRPVIVLSNNDGCAIARSNVAKALGVAMGAPWFKIKHLEQSAGLVALSANFVLYGDMSDRMMQLAAPLGSNQEIYSIDESFIDLTGIQGDLVMRSHKIRSRILQWIGIPCGIGIGQTKTLAKLANHIAKTAERKPGSYPSHLAQVCNLSALSPLERASIFEATDIKEVWGIGPRIAKQLHAGGIHTVQDLVHMDPATARRGWSVVLERTVLELQGTSCVELDSAPPPKRQIACTRSFGRAVTDLAPLQEAVSEYASRAAEKLRKQSSLASQVLVFIHTSAFRPGPQYSRSVVVPLRRPTSDTMDIVRGALMALDVIYRPGYQLSKAGVMLMDLQAGNLHQCELPLDTGDGDIEGRKRLMTAMDTINQRFGRGTMKLGSAGLTGDKSAWSMKQERRSPAYTTRLADIPVVRA